MKKIITAIATVLGFTGAQASEPTQAVDVKDIRYTMPTVAADDIEFVVPTENTFEGAPQFHEDEWCQIEFFQSSRLQEIQKMMAEYKTFEESNRTQYGWLKIYSRHMSRKVLAAGKDAENSIAKLLNAKSMPAPILTTTSKALGQVKDGFTLDLPGGVFLYGIKNPEGVTSLGAIVRSGGDDSQLVKAFMTLAGERKLILVDWRAQQILISLGSDGKISAWRP